MRISDDWMDRKRKDVYAISMKLESEARGLEAEGNVGKALRMWRDYTKLKLEKGSYFLASYGRYAEGRVLERMGKQSKAARKYAAAADLAESKCQNLDLAAFFLLESARCLESVSRLSDARRVYERMARMWMEVGNHFRAADAYERAVRVIERSGGSLKGYHRGGEEWMKCYEKHLEKGGIEDALWSLRRAWLYFERVGAKGLVRKVKTILERSNRSVKS